MQQKAEKIAGGLGAAAGPVFSRRGYLLFSDVTANRILKWERGEVSIFRENSNGACANTFDHQGRLLTCEKGRVTRTEKDGKITVLGGRAEGAGRPGLCHRWQRLRGRPGGGRSVPDHAQGRIAARDAR